MGDSRAGGGAGDGAFGRDVEPLTLEQLIARQGAGPSGRRAARRTTGMPPAGLQSCSPLCSKPPDGLARWSLRLLAERLVELEVVETVSHETVRRSLKKAN